jgi:apolipoprotein D and lipocalin family protein
MHPLRFERNPLFPHAARLCAVALAVLLAGCAGTPPNPNPHAGDPLPVAQVDLPRYMGHWFIIANIPYFGERAYVAGQSEWRLRPDGQIDDAYIGRKGGFDQPETRRTFVDSVVPNTGNAHWHVHLLGPLYASQLTLYVDPEYRYTLVGYPGKGLGWIFARSPDMSDAVYHEMLGRLAAMGYDTTRFKRVAQTPQQLGRPGFQAPGDGN